MSVADILAPSGLKRMVESFLDTLALALRRFRRGGMHFNAPPVLCVSMLNQLARLLRFTLLILACQLDLEPAPQRAAVASRPVRALRRGVSFKLFPSLRRGKDDERKGAAPACFQRGVRDPYITIARKLETLARTLANPGPLITRMARRLPKQLYVIGWRPPKRPPPAREKDYWDELVEAWREAWFHLHAFRRRTREREAMASAS